MKKRRVSLIIGLIVVILCFAGCAYAPLQESTPATTPETTPGSTPNSPENLEIIPIDSELIKELNGYVELYNASIDLFPFDIADRINSIKNGESAYRIKFDTAPLYYACAYYDGEHEYESGSFCCVYEHPYSWIGIESLEDIPQSYEGKKLIATVQIGGTTVLENILDPEDSRLVQHYLLYSPSAVSSFVELGDQFITFTSSDSDTVYYCTDKFHFQYQIRWTTVDDEYYIIVQGDNKEANSLKADLGEYYDELADSIVFGTYSEMVNGNKVDYGLLKLSDFIDLINK